MEIKYVEKGESGKTCADCSFYQDKGDGMGECFGHEVLATGGCNAFKAKNES